jgi:hypothetical protein
MRAFVAVVLVVAGCSSSDDTQQQPPPPTDGGGLLLDGGPDAIPPTSACAGDATRCLSGTFATSGFTAGLTIAKVELHRVFPLGGPAPLAAAYVARDGTFAFSNLDPWAHYYVKGIAGFGTSPGGLEALYSVATIQGSFAIPAPAGQSPIALSVIPAQLELLETSGGGQRLLAWVSAHVYDPMSGKELTDATVSFSAQGIAATPMPWVTSSGSASRYYVSFGPGVAATTGYQIQASHASLGGAPVTWHVATVPSTFDAAMTSPATGATVPAGQPLTVAWTSQPLADYAVIDFFVKQGSAWSPVYSSPTAVAPDQPSAAIPGSNVTAGSYLVDLELAQTSCGKGSDGCAYLYHTASATLTAQ